VGGGLSAFLLLILLGRLGLFRVKLGVAVAFIRVVVPALHQGLPCSVCCVLSADSRVARLAVARAFARDAFAAREIMTMIQIPPVKTVIMMLNGALWLLVLTTWRVAFVAAFSREAVCAASLRLIVSALRAAPEAAVLALHPSGFGSKTVLPSRFTYGIVVSSRVTR
jgi:hypothetical protein